MRVPESISAAYAAYLEGMGAAARSRRPVDGLLGLGRDSSTDRCQEEFVSALTAAVERVASDGEPGEARGAAEFMLTFALGHRDAGAAYWMLLASHVLALPLIELLSPPEARSLLEAYEAGYPRRDRLPAQKKVISALKSAQRREDSPRRTSARALRFPESGQIFLDFRAARV